MKSIKDWKQKKSISKFTTKPERAAIENISNHQSKVVGRHTKKKKPRSKKSAAELLSFFKKDIASIIGITILISGAVIYFGFYTSTFQIKHVNVSGTEFISQDEVYQEIDNYRSGNSLGFLSKNLFWFFNTGSLQSIIEGAFTESFALEQVTVSKKFPNTVSVEITERVPRIAWVTKSANGQENFSLLDHNGYVTQSVASFDELNQSYPRVRDDSRTQVEIGWQLISAEYIQFLLSVHENFETQLNLSLDSYIFPTAECFKQEYVSEKIFEQELLDTESDAFRDKKREIQERFQNGDISIDESIDALEQLKNDELAELGATDDGENVAKIQWETISVPAECDFVKTARELYVVTNDENVGFEIRLDVNEDLNLQLENVNSLLAEKNLDRSNIKYIDVRVPDRVFYKKKREDAPE